MIHQSWSCAWLEYADYNKVEDTLKNARYININAWNAYGKLNCIVSRSEVTKGNRNDIIRVCTVSVTLCTNKTALFESTGFNILRLTHDTNPSWHYKYILEIWKLVNPCSIKWIRSSAAWYFKEHVDCKSSAPTGSCSRFRLQHPL